MLNQSSRILGSSHGLTATEMNVLLCEEGFLEGSPGLWRLTEKGIKYAAEQHHSRGTGGSVQYNPSWSTRTWDPSITDHIDLSIGRKQLIRETARASRQLRADSSMNSTVPSGCEGVGSSGTGHSGLDPLKVVASLALAAAVTYGIVKFAPHLKKLWNERSTPRLRKFGNRATDDTTTGG